MYYDYFRYSDNLKEQTPSAKNIRKLKFTAVNIKWSVSQKYTCMQMSALVSSAGQCGRHEHKSNGNATKPKLGTECPRPRATTIQCCWLVLPKRTTTAVSSAPPGRHGVLVSDAPRGRELNECGDWSVTRRRYDAGGV